MNGGGDVIAILSARVSELSKRVALLQAELESALKRVAIYEEHDGTIQEALSSALRAAYTIRQRAETTAEQILEQAREERRVMLKEIERLQDERDRVQDEIATQRRSGLAALSSTPLSSEAALEELRSVANEALRGIFKEIIEDVRTKGVAVEMEETPASPQSAAVIEEEDVPSPAAPPVDTAQIEADRAATERAIAEREAADARAEEERAAAQRASEERAAAEARAAAERAAAERAANERAIAERAAAEQAARTPAPAPPPPLEVVRPSTDARDIAPARVEAATPTSDIQLVLTPVPSFPRLVEIERQIQALPNVRTLYVRDFRGGTATLAVQLRSSIAAEAFATLLAGLREPRLRLVAGSHNTLELRVEGEAGVA